MLLDYKISKKNNIMKNLEELRLHRNQVLDDILNTIDVNGDIEKNIEILLEIDEFLDFDPNVRYPIVEKYEEQLKQKVRGNNPNVTLIICDDERNFQHLRKGMYCNLIHEIYHYYLSISMYKEENPEDETYSTIITNRSTTDRLYIDSWQTLRDMIEWVVKNKKKGFIFDW